MRSNVFVLATGLVLGGGACVPVPPPASESASPIAAKDLTPDETGAEAQEAADVADLALEEAGALMMSDDACNWRRRGPAVRAQITGGPWTLGQGPATQMDPAAGYPAPNPGTNAFAPYFWPFVVGDAQRLVGYFDYRPRNMEEAVVAARSSDGGQSWTFLDKALTFNPNPTPNPLTGNENGQGHPVAIRIGGETFLYTLDRSPAVKDIGGLVVHQIAPTRRHPLQGAPAEQTPVSLATLRTEGLLNPDGIIGQVPGMPVTTIMYLQRVLGSSGPLSDVTTARLATTEDGIHFVDRGPVSGLVDDQTLFIGARGQVLRTRNGGYVLIFSGGIAADNASDAYHYIGCAVSSDLHSWTVRRGLTNPLMSIEATEASGQPQSWWMGRVFGPSLVMDRHGEVVNLMFAGYHTASPTNDLSDYRQIGVLPLAPGDQPSEDQDGQGTCATGGSPPDSGI